MQRLIIATLAVLALPATAKAQATLESIGAYQSSRTVLCALATPTSCTLTFAAIPAGRALEVKHVACSAGFGTNARFNNFALSTSAPAASGSIDLKFERDGQNTIVNQPITFFVLQGQTPTVRVSAFDASGIPSARCTVTGRLLTP